ncbi:hypothetical protein EDB81DRAFT_32947 [Dactylonectria macrodidyma]|uniref:Uncharacterized protein n=1 Tax=Dactylonectria macrodidyma TaxID=307937 RepID=A0A9P9JMY3_9HYPO|nr:hypothetical protein EDB81DRAFT_32947 [Dactylonectria macrodidyma]
MAGDSTSSSGYDLSNHLPRSRPPVPIVDPVGSDHVRIHSRCGACGFEFNNGDTFYAFVCAGNNAGWSAPFTGFGEYEFPCVFANGSVGYPWLFCRSSVCRRCPSSPESSTIHTTCLRLFLSQANTRDTQRQNDKMDLLRRLWLAATWRSPWPGLNPLELEPHVPYRSDRYPSTILDELPQLQTLPVELSSKMWEFCKSGLLWRYSAVLDMARELLNSPSPEPGPRPIARVRSWSRRGELIEEDGPGDSVIRLTIDSRGLERIERLAIWPSGSSPGFDDKAFVVEPAKALAGVLVDFQLGLAHLQLPANRATDFYTWDTPFPPLLKHSLFNVPIQYQPSRLRLLKLRGCTGITFFMLFGSTKAIHVHTARRPSAQNTFLTLTPHLQLSVSWIYVPIDSEILEFGFTLKPRQARGIRRDQAFLLRLADQEDVLIGAQNVLNREYALIKKPTTLIYDKTE